MSHPIRVRFAPSPTGRMHLGNVRAALLNALFAQKNNGSFLLRIEDTDQDRLLDPNGVNIISDLAWLNITYSEGPYFQSKRHDLYQEQFEKLQQLGLVYRCFETPEELEATRNKQLEQGLPPRYNRAGLKLTPEQIQNNIESKKPFIWRFKSPEKGTIAIHDIARGIVQYDLEHFSDFALTRQDGSFTFIFANFVDDMLMNITHVFRGEDHITNSANQAVLYKAFNVTQPLFYHLPLICNKEGKKLSKRDFGFSLDDLKNNGFLPEAICNYLALIGGTFKQEIMNRSELASTLEFNQQSPKGTIRYDIEKLRWINQKWILLTPPETVAKLCRPFLEKEFSTIHTLDHTTVVHYIKIVHKELVTLIDSAALLRFCFIKAVPSQELLKEYNDTHRDMIKTLASNTTYEKLDPANFIEAIKKMCKFSNIPLKEIFTLIRIIITGQPTGLGIKEIVEILGTQETLQRLNNYE